MVGIPRMNETITLLENLSIAKRGTVRLTTAQALVRYLSGLHTRVEGPQGEEIVPLFGGVFAIFGHGNVAGIGEALYQYRDQLPTYRAHNEQAMAHAAIAYSKAHFRRRLMACTTSIGPGATNLLSAERKIRNAK
jgi:3D-(3,5/4)-trihydroxycyclohexane-1,2-dione acylhydrolase (decyclizing)